MNWYEKALRGNFADNLARPLLDTLAEEISNEFTSLHAIPEVIINRHYENITDDFWKL